MQSLLSQKQLSAAKVLSMISGYVYLTDLFKKHSPSPQAWKHIYIIITYFQNIWYAKIFIYLWVRFACFYFLIYFQQPDTTAQ